MMPFIDKHKVAIWGWSYGGYAAAMSLAQGSMPTKIDQLSSLSNRTRIGQPHHHPQEVFECAVSVAPVTNWLYYDTAYTERYMASPYKNEQYDRWRAGDHQLQSSGQASSRRNDPVNLARLTVIDPNRSRDQLMPTTKPKTSPTKPKNATLSLLSTDLNERYRKASLLDFVSHMDRKRFLLIHGTADGK